MKAYDSDDFLDIKEEVIEAFDSPCIIEEDESPIVFPSSEEGSDYSSENCVSNSNTATNPLQTQDGSCASEIHTIGDISIRAINCEKKILNGLKVVSPPTLGLTLKPHDSLLESPQNERLLTEIAPVSHPMTIVHTPLALGILNRSKLIQRDISERIMPTPDCFSYNLKSNKSISKEKLGSRNSCCCPQYHKQVITLANREHERSISLLSEKIQAIRTKRLLHEEERQFQEQNFLLKQEERQSLIAEHQARMRLIELEFEAAKKKLKIID